MSRNFSRLALAAFGLTLALTGATALWRGWDIIQVERGWSLFIGGATALAGGAVVLALSQVVARLDHLLAALQTPPREEAVEVKPEARSESSGARPLDPAPAELAQSEPQEVDRYQSGDVTYVMFSDGGVEVRTATGAQRFASLAELRAQAAQ
jgi:hypothetical protein